MKKLNIGCGRDIREGWINLDSHGKLGADFIWDLKKLPLPFKNNTFDYLYCGYVLEDFSDPIPLIEEFVRVTKPEGKIEIQVAHETSGWDSLYHKRGFTMKALKDFVQKKDYGKERNLKIVKARFCHQVPGGKLTFRHRLFILYQKIMAFFCNFFPSDIIDYTFLKYLFTGISIKIIYQKIK